MIVLSQLSQLKVWSFLNEFKQLSQNGGLYITNRSVNQKALKNLNLTKQNCIDEILSLTVGDYCSGPDPDKDREGQVWVFGKMINATEIYIKLKIAETEVGKIAKCISFHPADHQLCYPCKNPKGGV